jgi:hypothetical protein
MKTKALAREDMKRLIMLAFAVELQSGRSGEMTLTDIAGKVNRAASTKLRDMVTELQIEGLIVARTEKMTGAVGFRRVYAPSALFDANTGKPKHEPRTIKIKGKKNGQMAMWTEVIT